MVGAAEILDAGILIVDDQNPMCSAGANVD